MKQINMELMEWMCADAISKIQHGQQLPTYIFPNRRMGVYFLQQISRQVHSPIWMPEVRTLNEWVMAREGPQVPPQAELLLTLFACYRTMDALAELESFLPWGEIVLNDMAELISHGIEPGVVFRNISELHDINAAFEILDVSQKQFLEKFFGSVRTPAGKETERFVHLWNALTPLTTLFRQQLLEKNTAIPADAFRIRLENLIAGQYTPEPFIIAGFHQLNPSEARVVQVLLRHPDSRWVTVWDEVMEEARMETLPMIQRLRSVGAPHQRIHCITNRIRKRSLPVQVVSATGLSHAMQMCGTMLSRIQVSNPSLRETAVIPSSEAFLEPVIRHLPVSDTTLEVNITMGYPLSAMQAWQVTNQWIGLQRYSGKYPRKSILAWLSLPINTRHPAAALLRAEILASGFPFIDLNRIGNMDPRLRGICETIIEQLNIEPEQPATQRLLGWAKYLNNWFAHQESVSEWEVRAALLILTSAEQLVEATNVTPITSWLVLRKLVQQLVHAVQIPFEGQSADGLQVMGLLEARNITFRSAILLPVCEGILPSLERGATFIPFTLRAGYGLALPQDREGVWAWHFYRLVAAVDELVLVVPGTIEDQQVEMSRFVRQLMLEHPETVRLAEGAWESPAFLPPPVVVHHTVGVKAALFKLITEKGLSPSALSTLVRCPVQFAYERLLRLDTADRKEESVDARDFGNIIHGVMEELYKHETGHEITPDWIDVHSKAKDIKLLAELVIRHTFHLGNSSDAITGKFRILRDVVPDMVTTILTHDRAIAPFMVRNVESYPTEAFTRELTVPAFGSQHIIRCLGKFDRVADNGKHAIITDFKTGSCNMNFKSISSLFTNPDEKYALQAMMYAWLYRPSHTYESTEVRFYPVRDMMAGHDVQPLRMGSGKQATSFYAINDQMIEHFEVALVQFLSNWLQDEYTYLQTPERTHCQHCDYRQLCQR